MLHDSLQGAEASATRPAVPGSTATSFLAPKPAMYTWLPLFALDKTALGAVKLATCWIARMHNALISRQREIIFCSTLQISNREF